MYSPHPPIILLFCSVTPRAALQPKPRRRAGLNVVSAGRHHGQPWVAAAAPHTQQPSRRVLLQLALNHDLFSVLNVVAAGTITITAEEIASDRATCNASFNVSCSNLNNTHWFSKPDPLLKLTRALPDGTVKVISQLPILRNTVAPSWSNLEIKSEDAANNNLQQPFRLEIWDFDGNRLIGYIEMTFNELLAIQSRGASSGTLRLLHPTAKSKDVGRFGAFPLLPPTACKYYRIAYCIL
jgi:hypothetical protein